MARVVGRTIADGQSINRRAPPSIDVLERADGLSIIFEENVIVMHLAFGEESLAKRDLASEPRIDECSQST
jgi:hypothetical protein